MYKIPLTTLSEQNFDCDESKAYSFLVNSTCIMSEFLLGPVTYDEAVELCRYAFSFIGVFLILNVIKCNKT